MTAAKALAVIKRVLRWESVGAGLRVVQCYYFAVLYIIRGFALFQQGSAFDQDLTLVRVVFEISACALVIWMLQLRMRAARPVAVAVTLTCLVLGIVDAFCMGAFDEIAAAVGPGVAAAFITVDVGTGLAVAAYMGRSQYVRETLALPFIDMPATNVWDGDETRGVPMHERVHTWAFWRRCAFWVMALSLVGHVVEVAVVRSGSLGGLLWAVVARWGWLWARWVSPFSVVGIVAALVLLPLEEHTLARLHHRVTDAAFTAMLAGFVLLALVEYVYVGPVGIVIGPY